MNKYIHIDIHTYIHIYIWSPPPNRPLFSQSLKEIKIEATNRPMRFLYVSCVYVYMLTHHTPNPPHTDLSLGCNRTCTQSVG